MKTSYVKSRDLSSFDLWAKMRRSRSLLSFDLELTARCNCDCRHCYINLPAGDSAAKKKELTLKEIESIADDAVSLGAVWCLLTGGEPLLRPDFSDIYLMLKKKGLLLSIFTNAVCLTEDHVRLFSAYPPRDIEVTVYGATRETYESVTRTPGSFDAFRRGLARLLKSGLKIRLKAMALRSNMSEFEDIIRFCKNVTKDYFRFDYFLQLRLDGDKKRNRDILGERISDADILQLETMEAQRFRVMEKQCEKEFEPEPPQKDDDFIFHCSAGEKDFTVGYDGTFRLCPVLVHPDCVYDLRKGSLKDAWAEFVPRVLGLRSSRKEYMDHCRICPLVHVCVWCPAHGYLETGHLDVYVPAFCRLAEARMAAAGYVGKAIC